ncbi:MAG: glutamyl-tRNA reductase [Bacteroidota bacterium]
MLQDYKILTVTHRRTNLKKISQFAIGTDNQEFVSEKLADLQRIFQLDECYYTATCNRVLFLFTTTEPLTPNFVEQFFQFINKELSAADIAEHVQTYEGMDTVRHFYEVGASVDSLVVGERQILGQLREGYAQSEARGQVGYALRLLQQHMIVAAKDIYANTRIAQKSLSVAALAVRKLLAHQLPKNARILLVGAGQTNVLISKFLVKYEFNNVTVFNRSPERAVSLANKFQGTGHALTELNDYQAGFDCIVVCTGAQEPILQTETIRQLLAGEDAKDKVIVDLAIPHNTAKEAVEELGFHYIEIEGLRELAEENRAFRERELVVVRERLENSLAEFPKLYQQRRLELAMREVPTQIKAVRQKALNEVFAKDLENLDDEAQALINEMLVYMEKKCIGIPMRVAREQLLE